MILAILLLGIATHSTVPVDFLSEESERIIAALDAAQQADAVYANALLLYLRLAGVIWIAVEWVAAVILWRAYRLLRHVAQSKEVERC
jgi:hypothetical protein